MRVLSLASTALLLACEVQLSMAKSVLHDARNLRRRHEGLEQLVRRDALNFMDEKLHPRQPQTGNAAPTQSAAAAASMAASVNDPTVNMTTNTACATALSSIQHVANPAGIAACYNVLFLNNQTGVFEADLRLYQVNQPSGMFAGIQSINISPAVTYPEATFSPVNKSKRAELDARQANNTMTELKQYSLVGQINKGLTLTALSQSDMMALVIPSLSLYAISPASTSSVSTNLTSASIAYFVTGVFSGRGADAAAAAAPSAAVAAANKASPFQLPGTKIAIFPVGGIITGAWTVLFVATVAFGTVGRMMSRRPAQAKLPTRTKSKSKTGGQAAVAFEPREFEITTHKTFGERPNYYIEHLAAQRAGRF